MVYVYMGMHVCMYMDCINNGLCTLAHALCTSAAHLCEPRPVHWHVCSALCLKQLSVAHSCLTADASWPPVRCGFSLGLACVSGSSTPESATLLELLHR
jgi:hypothetical protein